MPVKALRMLGFNFNDITAAAASGVVRALWRTRIERSWYSVFRHAESGARLFHAATTTAVCISPDAREHDGSDFF